MYGQLPKNRFFHGFSEADLGHASLFLKPPCTVDLNISLGYFTREEKSNNFFSGGGSGGPGGGSGGPGGGSGGPGGRPSVPSVPSPFWSNAKNPGQNLVKNLAQKIGEKKSKSKGVKSPRSA